MRKDSRKIKSLLFRITLLIIFLVVIILSGLWINAGIQNKKVDQQFSQKVSEVVAQTLTSAASFPAVKQTPSVNQNSPAGTPELAPSTLLVEEANQTEVTISSSISPTIPVTPAPELCSPIEGVPIEELESIISQLFNVPNQLSDSGHHGVDLGSYDFHGQYLFEIPVRAILPGQVAGITVNRPPIGNVVILETKYAELPQFLREALEIEPGQSLYHFYGHLVNEPVIEIGTRMNCGDQIDLLGKSRTVEAHLHLETRIGKSGLIISQMAFYDAATTEEERAEYLWWRTSGELTAIDPMLIFQIYLEQQ